MTLTQHPQWKTTAQDTFQSTTVNIPIPAGISLGDLMFCSFNLDNPQTANPTLAGGTSGTTWSVVNHSTDHLRNVFYRFADAGDVTDSAAGTAHWTMTVTDGFVETWIVAGWSGVDTTTPFAVGPTVLDSSSATTSFTSITSPGAGSIFVGFYNGGNNNGTTTTPTSGTVEANIVHGSVDNGHIYLLTDTVASGATGTYTGSIASAFAWTSVDLILNPAAASSPVKVPDSRRQSRRLLLRGNRRSAPTVTPAQVVVAAPAKVKDSPRQARRLLRGNRRSAPTVVPAQVVVAAPVFINGPQRQARRLLRGNRRPQPGTVPPQRGCVQIIDGSNTSTMTFSGASVTAVRDLVAGHNYTYTGIASGLGLTAPATNGLPALTFAQANSDNIGAFGPGLKVPMDASTVFIVFNASALGAGTDRWLAVETASPTGFLFHLTAANVLAVGDWTAPTDYLTGVTTVTTGVWHIAAVTQSGVDRAVYLDGTTPDATSATVRPSFIAEVLQIGSTFDGLIGEVSVFNSALGSADFATEYNRLYRKWFLPALMPSFRRPRRSTPPARSGRALSPVPAQQTVIVPAMVPDSRRQARRILRGNRRPSPIVTPAQATAPVAVFVADPRLAGRRFLRANGRKAQTVVPAQETSVALTQARRRGVPARRGRSVVVTPAQQTVIVPATVPDSRRQARRILRGNRRPSPIVTPAQATVIAPAYVTDSRRTARRILRGNRRPQPIVTPAQVATPNPNFVTDGRRRATRALRGNPKPAPTVVPAQQAAPVNPAFVPKPTRRVLGAFLRRHALTTAPIDQTAPPGVLRRRTAAPAVKRRSVTVVAHGQTIPVEIRRRPARPVRVTRRPAPVAPVAQQIPPKLAPMFPRLRRAFGKVLPHRITQVFGGSAAPIITSFGGTASGGVTQAHTAAGNVNPLHTGLGGVTAAHTALGDVNQL